MKFSSLTTKPSVLVALAVLFLCTSSVTAEVDLSAAQISYPSRPAGGSYHPGDSLSVRMYVYNNGDETSGDYTIEVYADGYRLFSESGSGLEAQSTHERTSATLSLPNDISYGVYCLRLVVRCPDDTVPGNDETEGSDFTVAEKGPPDLELESLGVVNKPKDNTYYNGDSVALHYWVENVGHSALDSYTVNFYIDGKSAGSESRAGLVEHDGEWVGSDLILSEDIEEGTYGIDVVLSCANDPDSGNNSDSVRVKVARKAPPKISVRYVDAAEGIYKPGDSIKVTVDVKCGDGQLPGELGLDFYASTDDNISPADYRIGSRDFSNLDPDETYTFSANCYFPSNLPDGDYYIGVVVDYPDQGDVTYDGVPVWVGAPVDLIVQTVNATDGTYLPSEQIQVYSLIKNAGAGASEGYTIDYYLSPDTTISAADTRIGYAKRDGLAPGAQHSYETTCQLPINLPAGQFYVGSIVTYAKDNVPANNTGLDTTPVGFVHPAGYVCGRVDYPDKYKNSHPIRYACVGIYAEDTNQNPLNDRLLGETHTDQNGDYAAILPNDENGAGDIYVKVLAEGVSGAYPESTGRICVLKDAVLKETYTLVSTAYPHPQAASVIINLTTPGSGEFMVFDSIVEGFCKAKTAFDVEMPEISAFWPSDDGGSYFDPCNLEMYISQDDRRDRDVIMHEYGHYIADIYGVGLGPVGDNPIHFWDLDLRQQPVWRSDEHAMNLAFREAWATVFCVASQYRDIGYPNSGDSKYDDVDEETSHTNQVDLKNYNTGLFSPGQYYENMNAGALWDVFTGIHADGDDAPGAPSLAMIWAISRDYQPDNIMDFWTSWFQEYDYEQTMRTIFSAHGMSLTKPDK